MATDRGPDFDTWIHPRDILTPAATLLGLVVAAIGLSSTIEGSSSIIRTLSSVLILVVLLFATAAMATCASTLRRSYRLFRVGVVLFGMGWAFTALVISLFLIGYAWGINVLQITIPQIPHLDIASVISITFSIVSLIATFWSYRKARIDKRQLTDLLNELPQRDTEQAKELLNNALKEAPHDPKMALVKLAIDIEGALRSKARSLGYPHGPFVPLGEVTDFLLHNNAIEAATAASIKRIRTIKNIIVHSGGDISPNDARVALNLAATVLTALSDRERDSDR
jgi:hypothetical protein